MILVKPSFEIFAVPGRDLDLIEAAGRVCYKSEMARDLEKRNKFISSRIRDAHESVLEHSMLSVKFICDRGVSHELVRHRLCAFSQESTRYCNYKGGVTFVIPPWVVAQEKEYNISWNETLYGTCQSFWSANKADLWWFWSCAVGERDYMNLLSLGWSPQQARSVLPNSLKTEIVVTANFREWRHIFKLRTAKAAHPQMRELMCPLLDKVKTLIPIIFDDINY